MNWAAYVFVQALGFDHIDNMNSNTCMQHDAIAVDGALTTITTINKHSSHLLKKRVKNKLYVSSASMAITPDDSHWIVKAIF